MQAIVTGEHSAPRGGAEDHRRGRAITARRAITHARRSALARGQPNRTRIGLTLFRTKVRDLL